MKQPKPADALLFPSQVAAILGITLEQVKAACTLGVMKSTETEGGHLRIAMSEVERYRREEMKR